MPLTRGRSSSSTSVLGLEDQAMVAAGLAVVTGDGHLIDRFRDRIMFPAFDNLGDSVGFIGRGRGGTVKYLSNATTPVHQRSMHSLAWSSRRGGWQTARFWPLSMGRWMRSRSRLRAGQRGVGPRLRSVGAQYRRLKRRLCGGMPDRMGQLLPHSAAIVPDAQRRRAASSHCRLLRPGTRRGPTGGGGSLLLGQGPPWLQSTAW
jgi:hypothetical protein